MRAQCCEAHEQKHVRVGTHVLGASFEFAGGGRVIEHAERESARRPPCSGAGGALLAGRPRQIRPRRWREGLEKVTGRVLGSAGHGHS